MQDRENMIIINNFIENDPLSENNLDKTLDLVNEFRLSYPQKSIWLYSGYIWESIMEYRYPDDIICFFDNERRCMHKRQQIISQCGVLVDGKYIDSKRNITLSYRGSANQRVIDIQRSLQEGEVVLWQV